MVRLKNALKVRTRKVGAILAALASVAGTVLAVAPATAASAAGYPTSSFSIEVGASYYRGTVTWYNRSVGVTGSFKAVGCRRIYGEAWAGDTYLDTVSSSTWCDRSGSAPFAITADVVGGANELYIWMTTEDPDYFLEGAACYRGVSVCSPF